MTTPRKLLLGVLAVAAIAALAWFGFWLDGVYHAWRWGSPR